MKGEITLTKVKSRQCIGDIEHLISACPPKFNCSSAYQDGGCSVRTYGGWVFYAGLDVFDQKWRKKCVKIEYPQLFSSSFLPLPYCFAQQYTWRIFWPFWPWYFNLPGRIRTYLATTQAGKKKSGDFFKAWRQFRKKLDGERLREIGSLQPIQHYIDFSMLSAYLNEILTVLIKNVNWE